MWNKSRRFEILKFLVVRSTTAGLAAIVIALTTFGQTQAAPPSDPQRAPLAVLYRHFLAYQNHLDRVGAALEKQSKNGSDFKDHFQRQLGFSDADFALVRATALRLEARLNEQDAKAKAIIDAIHSQHPKQLTSPADLPPFPPELAQMQKERDAIIVEEVDKLRASLGAAQAAKLDALIENDFARNMKIENIGPPIWHDPSQNPLPPLRDEVKP